MLFILVISTNALNVMAEDKDAEQLCEVITRSNMRQTPSKEGNWVATVPEGAVAMVLSDDGSDFMYVRYGNSVGYIYRGCISVKKEHTKSEYNEQFGITDNVSSPVDNIVSGDEQHIKATASMHYAEYVSAHKDSTVDKTEGNKPAETIADSGVNETDSIGVSATFFGTAGTVTGDSIAKPSAKYQTTGVVATDLRLRSGPSTSDTKLTTIPRGATVNIIDEGENGFYHVEYDGQVGYAYSSCVKNDGPVGAAGNADTSYSSDVASIGGNGLLIAGTRRNSTRELNEESQTNVAVPSSNIQPQPELNTSPFTPNVSYEVSSRANMRSMPDKESDKITTLPVGAEVIALGKSKGGYTLVQYNGVEGYILEELVTEGVSIAMSPDTAVLFTLTAYCPCQICCGKFSPEVRGGEPRTSTGTVPVQGRTIAVDPSVIPYGTRVNIEGLGSFVAEDCGSGIKEDHIDVYFENHEDAKAFGVKRLYVTIEQ